MSRVTRRRVAITAAAILSSAAAAAVVASQPSIRQQTSTILAQRDARREDFAWGSLYTYYDAPTYATRDGLAAVAVIKPGQEIHPPHAHAEEEYLMVIEGEGTWSMMGKERPARAGDMQYAAPWDLHGIRNTGRTPLRFVVWKWNSKGVAPTPEPKK